MIKLLENEALLFDKYLIIADIHFGDFFVYDIEILEHYKNEITSKIIKILEKEKKRKMIINGDLKESIGLPNKIIRKLLVDFLESILNYVEELIIIKGNHDGKIEEILSDLKHYGNFEIIKELILRNTIIYHGHRKVKDNSLLDVSTIITAHIHPAINFSPLRKNIKAWLLGHLNINIEDEIKDLNWIVLPAFSDYTYGLALNQLSDLELLSLIPIKGTVKLDKVTILLKDLTPVEEREIDVEGQN